MSNSPSPDARARIAGVLEWCWVLGLFLGCALYLGATQPVAPGEASGGEGQALHAMAQALPRELLPPAAAPYAYRIGLPMVVAVVAKSADWVVSAGFDRLNVAFNLISVWLLLILLRREVSSAPMRIGLIAAFLIEPHSPMRFSAFHPVSTDAAVMMFALAGLVGVRWFEDRPGIFRAAPLAALVGVGVAVHEVVLVIALSLLCARQVPGPAMAWRDWWRDANRSGAWIPVFTGALVLTALHLWIEPVSAAPSAWTAAADALLHRSPLRYVLAWLLVFGVPLLVIATRARRSMAELRTSPAFPAFLVLCGLAALVSDADVERVLALASPVILVVAGRVLMAASLATSMPVAAFALHALSSRAMVPIGGPIETPEVLGQVWERLVSPQLTWALSYSNMWAQSCAPTMTAVYVAWFAGCAGVLLLAQRTSFEPVIPATLEPSRLRALTQSRAGHVGTFAILALVAVLPIAWISGGHVYESTYAAGGARLALYNGARIWLVAALLLVFWSTGARIMRVRPAATSLVDAMFTGAAAWSLLTVVLAAAHLYYSALLLALFAAALVVGFVDLWRTATLRWLADVEWSPLTIALGCVTVVHLVAILVGIVLWGHPGADNDVLGNYLPYYDWTLQHHTIAPGPYWVHFFASKGNGLGLMANALSDVQGAGLATFAVVLMGAALLGRLSLIVRVPLPIALLAVSLYLQHFAAQGAYAKSHTIRNTMVVYLIVSASEWLWSGCKGPLTSTGRLMVIAAVIVLSPLALAIVLPVVLIPAVLGLVVRRAPLRTMVIEPAWCGLVTVAACAYNYAQTGLIELHSMPSVVGRLVDVDRLGQWLDPALRYLDYRLVFLQAAMPGAGAGPVVGLPPTEPVSRVLSLLLDRGTVAVVAAGVVAVVASMMMRSSRDDRVRTAALSGVSFLAALAVVAALRMFGGGPDSSMGRFTGFADALALALVVVMVGTAWRLASASVRMGIGTVVAAGGVAALLTGWPPVAALPWRQSVDFLLGRTSYAAMHEGAWSTLTASRVAAAMPAGARADMIAFLPGFTGIPRTPFQRPDGTVYLRDYSKVLYAPADEGARLYDAHGINYFLFDLAPDASTLWSGFSDLFAPDNVRTRFTVVTHVASEGHDLYLTTWRRPGDGPDADIETLASGWARKLATEKAQGLYYSSFEATRQSLARDAHPVTP